MLYEVITSEKVLSQLQVGMIKYNVEVLVFEANAVLTRPPKKNRITSYNVCYTKLLRVISNSGETRPRSAIGPGCW